VDLILAGQLRVSSPRGVPPTPPAP
jgi:hypothetical protein